MKLIVVGLSYHTAPLEVRERLAFPPTELDRALREICKLPHVAEAALVSTCNRVEVYAAAPKEEAGVAELRSFFGSTGRVEPETLAKHLYDHGGDRAIRHLFRVSSALDSMVLGESQILGQVKAAYGASVRAGTLGPLMTRALERAFSVAKRVRTETRIAEGSASVSAVAVDLARSIFGDLSGCVVLLLGAGKMSALAVRHLRSAGAARVIVTSRTMERAQELAAQMEAEPRPWEDLESLLHRADVVIASTGSPVPILSRRAMKQVVRKRRHRPLFLVDIAVPRDIEPEVGQLGNVFLYDIDDLQKVAAENVRGRGKEAEEAERIVDAEVRQFSVWVATQSIVPTVKDLRARADAIVRDELARTLPVLDERAGAKVAAMAEAIVSKLLHAPLVALRRDGDLAAPARKLFDLDPSPQVSSSPEEVAAEPMLTKAANKKEGNGP